MKKLLSIFPLLVFLACSGASTIDGNLDAARLVEPGMSFTEVSELIASPRPPWTLLMLTTESRSGRPTVSVSSASNTLTLTPELVDLSEDAPYVVWIFFPKVTASSRPTFVYFDRDSERVIHVGRMSCDDTIALLAAGGQHTGLPLGAAC